MSNEEKLTNIKYFLLRKERNRLLKLSDIYMIPDYPHVSEEKKNEWIAYRKALRDLPLTITTINIDDTYCEISGFEWPTPPS